MQNNLHVYYKTQVETIYLIPFQLSALEKRL